MNANIAPTLVNWVKETTCRSYKLLPQIALCELALRQYFTPFCVFLWKQSWKRSPLLDGISPEPVDGFSKFKRRWKLKIFCRSCIELIVKFLSHQVLFSAWIFLLVYFQECKTHLKSLVFDILLVGNHSSSFHLFHLLIRSFWKWHTFLSRNFSMPTLTLIWFNVFFFAMTCLTTMVLTIRTLIFICYYTQFLSNDLLIWLTWLLWHSLHQVIEISIQTLSIKSKINRNQRVSHDYSLPYTSS